MKGGFEDSRADVMLTVLFLKFNTSIAFIITGFYANCQVQELP